MATKIRQQLAPRKARTDEQIMALPYDNTGTDEASLMLGPDSVSVHGLTSEGRTDFIRISREVFDELVDWYNTGKIPSFESRPASTDDDYLTA